MSRQAVARVILSLFFAFLIRQSFSFQASTAAAAGVLVSEVIVAVWGFWTLRQVMRETSANRIENSR